MTRSSILILSTTSTIMAAMIYAWWPNLAVALALEDSPFAWLQSGLLVACATVAGIRALIDAPGQSSANIRARFPWALLSLLLVLAALDERFMFHERIQEFLLFGLLRGDPALRPWTQALMLIYALAGIGVTLWLRRAMAEPAWRWCRAAVVLGIAAVALDVAFDSLTIQILEELVEAAAETLFLCGLFMEVDTRAYRQS